MRRLISLLALISLGGCASQPTTEPEYNPPALGALDGEQIGLWQEPLCGIEAPPEYIDWSQPLSVKEAPQPELLYAPFWGPDVALCHLPDRWSIRTTTEIWRPIDDVIRLQRELPRRYIHDLSFEPAEGCKFVQ